MTARAEDAPVVCWPWKLWFLQRGPIRGSTCDMCQRDVARPMKAAPSRKIICLYCATELGDVEEAPIGEPLNEFDYTPRPKRAPRRPAAKVLHFPKALVP